MYNGPGVCKQAASRLQEPDLECSHCRCKLAISILSSGPVTNTQEAGGNLGKYLVEALVKTGKHQVTALTRADSTSKAPDGVEVKKVNYDDQNSLVEALQGQDILIVTMGVMAPEDQQTKLIDAAAKANVKWVMPNEWGINVHNDGSSTLGKDTFLVEKLESYRKHIEELGVSSWIGVTCGFWYEYSLAAGSNMYGFDFKNKNLVFIDDGNTKINTSTWPQCGRAIASLLSFKILPNDENDKSPSLAQFRNKDVYISSFTVSQKDMFESVLRVTGDKADDWKISHEEHVARYRSGVEMLQSGNRSGFGRLLYTRVFYPDGSGNYEASVGLHNDLLGLPKEDLDEYTRIAIERSKTALQF